MSPSQRIEMGELVRQAAFRRFCKRMIGHAGLISAQASATADELRAREGRRALALILIGEVAEADIRKDRAAALTCALIQLLGEPDEEGADSDGDGEIYGRV